MPLMFVICVTHRNHDNSLKITRSHMPPTLVPQAKVIYDSFGTTVDARTATQKAVDDLYRKLASDHIGYSGYHHFIYSH